MTKNNNGNTILEDIKDVSGNSIEFILKDKNLVSRIVKEVHKEFCGEDETIIALIIIINTRLVKGCKPESRNIVISEMSGAGKDKLVKTICKVMLEPEISYFHRSKLTPEVFTYWHTKDDNWNWDGKVIHVEDPNPELLDCQGFKTMASGEKSATVVDKQIAKDLMVKGKPNLIITTYEGCANIEGVRRYPFIHLDTSDNLTKEVMKKALQDYSSGYRPIFNNELNKALTSLQSYDVVIPYANDLLEYMPSDIVMRTYIHRFLDYIASSTVLHQYQREINEDGKLIATAEDYGYARITFMKTVGNHTMLPLNREQENLLDILVKAGEPLFVSDIHKDIAKDKPWIYRNLEVLKRYGIVKQEDKFKEEANRVIASYEVVPRYYCGISLPSTERFFQISTIFENTIENGSNIDICYNKKCRNIEIPKENGNRNTIEKPQKYQNDEMCDIVKKFGGKLEKDIVDLERLKLQQEHRRLFDIRNKNKDTWSEEEHQQWLSEWKTNVRDKILNNPKLKC